jgi:hypothetical protein
MPPSLHTQKMPHSRPSLKGNPDVLGSFRPDIGWVPTHQPLLSVEQSTSSCGDRFLVDP